VPTPSRPLLALASLVLLPLAGCGLLSPDKGTDTAPGQPMLNIVQPARNQVIAESTGVYLSVVGGAEGLSHKDFTLSWASDIDGTVDGPTTLQSDGTAQANLTLSPGTHTLVGTLVDTLGNADTAERTFVVDGMPSAPDVSITPAEPGSGDELVAALAFQPDLDPEGEEVSMRWSWLVDGEGSGESGDRVAASETAEGEVWTVQVWASDSRQEGPVGEADVVIGP
jgi:hypothetical protein